MSSASGWPVAWWRRSSIAIPVPVRLERLPEYLAARSRLDEQQRYELEFVEIEIAADQDHRRWRHELGEAVYDYSALQWGLIVAYRLVGGRGVDRNRAVNVGQRRK